MYYPNLTNIESISAAVIFPVGVIPKDCWICLFKSETWVPDDVVLFPVGACVVGDCVVGACVVGACVVGACFVVGL